MNPKFGVGIHLGVVECDYYFKFAETLNFGLISRKIMSRAYCKTDG